MIEYIFVTGSVVSGIREGINTTGIGHLLKNRGFSIFTQEFNPYLNIDPGTMSPYQYEEVFITKGGTETDLDLGHYERFTGEELTKKASITTGEIYLKVVNKEYWGDYDGKTVRVVPHVTDRVKGAATKAAKKSDTDVVITEIGGAVGDVEPPSFIEAIRQVHSEHPRGGVTSIRTVLVP